MQFADYVQTNQTPPADAEALGRRAKLYDKINRIQRAMRRVAKNGYNDFHKYAYATEADLIDAIRDQMDEVKIAVLPPKVLGYDVFERPKKHGGVEYVARVVLQYGLADCETGETENTVMIAEGSDTLDKAFYKAYAGGMKYFLMKTFMVATGDDPEASAPTLRSTLIASLREAWAALPEAERPALTKAQINSMDEYTLYAAIGDLTGFGYTEAQQPEDQNNG